MQQVIEAWLNGRELTADQSVQAVMLINLAADYDDKRATSTLEAFRRTFNDFRKELGAEEPEFDPLAKLLTR
jgi:hypothetical protein